MEKYNFGEDEIYLLAQNLVGAQNLEEMIQSVFDTRPLEQLFKQTITTR